mmetsp:Transcript_9638/g.16016  ORF Transcript_9638/g.16016 Transcript_9638/m.16016 type:complete len:384 (-) Transcript_9638:83-1234(-)
MDDPVAWFTSLPPITRTWLGAATGITALVTLDFLPAHQLLFDWARIMNDLELWRIATSFLYCGGRLNEFHVLILLYLIHNHGKGYEMHPFMSGGGRSADAAFAFLFCIVTILISFPIINKYGPMVLPERYSFPFVLYPLFTRTLVYAILYLWSRRNPNARVNLNFIPVQGRYLPFAYVGFSLALGNRLNELIHGIVVGHIYFYLIEVAPTVLNRRILTTPRFLVDLLGGPGGGAADYVVVDDFVADDSDEDVGLPPPPPAPTAEEQREILRQNDGASDAHIAAKTGSLQALRVLARTDEGAHMLHARDRNDWTPLHEGVRLGDLGVVDFLIDENVDINARTQEGRGFSPLWLAQATHGPDHPVTILLRELGAQEIDPEWEEDR